jgi:signal transduction histidine kinase
LRGILAHMTEAVFLVDAEGRIVTANQAASATLAVTEGGALPSWLAKGVEALTDEPSEPGQRHTLEHEGRAISLSVASLPVEGSPVEGRLFVALDVTEQMEVERMRADFVAYASHELRTPLTTIKTMVRLLLMDAEPTSTEHEYLTVIDTQAARQTRLINNLLDFTRLEAGKYELQTDAVSPRAVIGAASSACRPMALEKGLDLQVDGKGLPSFFISDGSALEQVLVNLLSNAIKFTEAGGVVLIGGTVEDGHLSFAVSDSGIGMNSAELERIFTRFYTVHHPRKHGEGTGLGLVISRMIVERLGGRIEVQSREGEGSTFRVTLPAERIKVGG